MPHGSQNEEEGVVKDKKIVDWILECVNDNLLFLKLDREQRERVVQRMRLVKVQSGNNIITQGDVNATTFYVCESGSFDILVDKVKVGQYKRGGCFGELALLYDSPRAATIVATSDSEVWEVSRNAFRYEVASTYKQKNLENVEFLKKVELFSWVTFCFYIQFLFTYI
ncbi:cAMP-dependent protein kinase type II regulatory subunit [Reticulomyxa filosa]|uniref:cGMP-dependent protein kinase n=1 Tax=Reticulomyxa filosa TaxID=46433 RepID=X6LTX4_RETFI|nr:cAMP-dependent protein kinase type II regulatory subunit [Reticulomyxa filosa]|eukprot:ETO04180.1 cAMP-dependent protein kinase type II regulatory subunit [Reticulomyxa filosa]